MGQFIFGHFVCVWGVWIALLSRCNPFRCSSSPSDFFFKILRSFISIQIPGVALNWYFLKLSLWLTNEPYACAQNIESMNQQKKKNKKKFNFSISLFVLIKYYGKHLIKLHNFFLLLNTKKDVSLFLFWQCMLIWSSASLWQVMNHRTTKSNFSVYLVSVWLLILKKPIQIMAIQWKLFFFSSFIYRNIHLS